MEREREVFLEANLLEAVKQFLEVRLPLPATLKRTNKKQPEYNFC